MKTQQKIYFSVILILSSFIFLLVNSCSGNASEDVPQIPQKPNIIFILIDDMGWNGLSCYGNQYISTPHIDLLAENGMKFTQAYTAPECLPTRAEFLSGQYGARTGMTQVHTNRLYPYAPLLAPAGLAKLPFDNYTVANMLKDAGYVTGISGKWHVGNANAEEKRIHYGFDFVGNASEKPWGQIDKDKGTPAQTSEILQFIRENKNNPFFAYLSYFNIHTPLQAPDSLVQKFVSRGYEESTNRFGDATETPSAHYLAMINLLDNEIGNLTSGLEEMELLRETMIIFISDNGGLNRAWDNCPLRGAKGVFYEGGIRVPMIIHWPEVIPGGSENHIPVHIVDMYPTFKELAEGNVPENKILDGESLIPLITQQGDLNRENIYWHHPHYTHDYGKTPCSGIRKGDYKLIYYYGDYLNTLGYMPVQAEPYGELIEGEKVELFNINEDPGELKDLSEEKPELAKNLLEELKTWLDSVDASVPVKNDHPDVENWYFSKNRN